MTAAAAILRTLRARGLRVYLATDGTVRIKPASRVSAEEIAAARAHRDELAALLAEAAGRVDQATQATGTSTSTGDHVREREQPTAAIATSWPDPTCASCGTTTASVFVEMSPGHDRLPWALCGRCWRSS